jgi:hypothetical protein
MLHCNYLNAVILPDGFILDEYRDYFENFLIDIAVPKEFYYSPTLFAESQYGTADLDFLVLYFAKMNSLFEFNRPVIKFLPVTSLSDLNKLIVQNRLNVRNSKTNPTLYRRLDDIKLPIKGYLETSNTAITTTSKSSVSRINTGSKGITPSAPDSGGTSGGKEILKSDSDFSQENGRYELAEDITTIDYKIEDLEKLMDAGVQTVITTPPLATTVPKTTTVPRTPTAYGSTTAPGGGDLKGVVEY